MAAVHPMNTEVLQDVMAENGGREVGVCIDGAFGESVTAPHPIIGVALSGDRVILIISRHQEGEPC